MSFFSSYCLLHEKFTEWVERQLSQDIKHSSDNNQALVQICQKGTIKYSLFLAPQLIYHTGSFAPNSFQIDTINSYSTSKKVQF
jgi:hypothetical protein